MPAQSLFIDGRWIDGSGDTFHSTNPATEEAVWQGQAANHSDVDRAVEAAYHAQTGWANTPIEKRIALLESFVAQLKVNRARLVEAISREAGKPLWESNTEVDSMIGKIPLSIAAMNERRPPTESTVPGGIAATRFKPIGVVAVLGPFNFPGHLPNGHIVPALLAGNAVIFKPSELTPMVAQVTIECWHATGLPPGVINLVQGGASTGAALSGHPTIDGLFFTGSASVGTYLNTQFAAHPEKILALEMGGNNPLIVHGTSNIEAATYLTIQSAFITAGQRCTCARRLIVPKGAEGDRFLELLVERTKALCVGAYTDLPEPFIGPVISAIAASKLLKEQDDLESRGGKALIKLARLPQSPAMLSPGIIDVTGVTNRADAELFGPLLQVIRVDDFEAAIRKANNTQFGLAAGLLSDSRELYEQFAREIRAGVVNWNRPTTGASGSLPFGGIGRSGNHRPSGYYAADYCSYAVAVMETPTLTMPDKLLPGMRR
jgi:succinylglutamic semialdehyde dehydrogenase